MPPESAHYLRVVGRPDVEAVHRAERTDREQWTERRSSKRNRSASLKSEIYAGEDQSPQITCNPV
eukprot:49702-Rhodomonas_salina.2